MIDIEQRLRAWVEQSAEPVTAEEAIRRGSRSERSGSRRGLVAVLSGAAAILLLIGLPLLVLQPFEPEGTATTSPLDGVPLVTAPAWEGRGISSVRAEADRLGIELQEEPIQTTTVSPGTVIRQSPAPGEALGEEMLVTVGESEAPGGAITTVTPLGEGATCPLPQTSPRPGERYLTVFFGCLSSLDDQVQPVLRAVPIDTEDYEAVAYEALLRGPTDEERRAGIESGFGDGTTGLVSSVTFDEGTLVVDLDRQIADLTPVHRDVTALFATGFQFETTARVELRVQGSCEEFADWSGRECSMSAATWWYEGAAEEMIAGWPEVVARPQFVSGECEVPLPQPGEGEMVVTVVFSCRTEEDSLLALAPVMRLVEAGTDPVASTITELVRGPNGTELANGVVSFLSERTARMFERVTLQGARLVVDFRPFVHSPDISNISTSTGGLVFNIILNANLFQFPEVEEIEYRVDGSCDNYWAHFEAQCSIQTRENHRRALEELTQPEPTP